MTDTTADIAAIREALPRRKDDGQGGAYLYHDADAWASACNPERIARLLDALDQARNDAARYRWLRDAHPATESVIAVDWRDPRKAMRHGDLDAAIDAAMKDHT